MILLAIALAAASSFDAVDKAEFNRCLKAHVHSVDDITHGDGVETCLKEARNRSVARGEVDGPPSDPIAKKVADDEAYEYLLVSTADTQDPIAKCTQASLTAQAYLSAKMPYKYNSWKEVESRDCKAAGVR